MPLVPVKCTSCGGDIQLDSSKEFGYCLYCGTKVIYQEAIQNIEISNLPTIDNLLTIAMRAHKARQYQEAVNYFNRVLELDCEHWWAIFMKSESQCRIASLKSLPVLALIEDTKKSLAFAETCNSFEGMQKIKKVFSNAILQCLYTMVERGNLSKYKILDSMETLVTYGDNFSTCFLGYSFCLSLIKEIPHENDDLIAVYEKILFLLSELSVHRKLQSGRIVGTLKDNRKTFINSYEKYKKELLSIDPNATIPPMTYDYIETTGGKKKSWW